MQILVPQAEQCVFVKTQISEYLDKPNGERNALISPKTVRQDDPK